MAEGNRQRRVFPDAFKLEAVAAVQGGRSVSQVAAELGLPDRLVRSCVRMERDILKQAALIFGQATGRR